VKVSVIIPTYNEEKTIAATLKNLFDNHHAEEVIVVDGGSVDNTVPLAKRWAQVIESDKGRARQMNVGAKESQGDVLLFLHADTILPQGGIIKIRDVIKNGSHAGRFRMRFDQSDWLLRIYEMYTRFQIFSYGDQGYFVTRDLFDQLNGFREDTPFEDIDFYRRLRKLSKPTIIKEHVITSARRFEKIGHVRQKIINLFLVGLYSLGFKTTSLKKSIYTDVR